MGAFFVISLWIVHKEVVRMNEEKRYDYFLVCYDGGYKNGETRSGELTNKEILKFFVEEGFECDAGYWGCPWYFVNIVNKKYKPGRPGVSYGKVIGDHGITFKEFKIINDIYKKYSGTLPLTINYYDYRYNKIDVEALEKKAMEIINQRVDKKTFLKFLELRKEDRLEIFKLVIESPNMPLSAIETWLLPEY